MGGRDRAIVEIHRRELDPDERAIRLVANDPVRALLLPDDFEGRGAGKLLVVTDEVLSISHRSARASKAIRSMPHSPRLSLILGWCAAALRIVAGDSEE